MLLIDGSRYEQWIPPNEELLESAIKEHSKEIFGSNSIYLDLKHKLQGSDIAGIPDAYVITLDPDKLWIVEVELSTHNVYEHIMPQLGKFLSGLKKPATRDRLRDLLYHEIEKQSDFKKAISQKGEIFRFVSNLVANTPEIAVIIDRLAPGLEDLDNVIGTNIKICEFTTFCKAGAGLSAHVHAFEPIYFAGINDYSTLWQSLLNGVETRGIPIKYFVSKRSFQKIPSGQPGIHFEWLAYPDGLGVELHFERTEATENRRLLTAFKGRKSELEKELDEQIKFDSSFHRRWSRLILFRSAGENERPPHIGDELRRWAIEKMVGLYKICKPILNNT
jgi:hypothetical protein